MTGSGSMRIAGASTTVAPTARRLAASPLACARARVTAIVCPARGAAERHASSSASSATAPTSVIAGAFACWSPSVPTVQRSTRWSGSVPRSTIAAGSSAARPWATSCSEMRGSWRTPM